MYSDFAKILIKWLFIPGYVVGLSPLLTKILQRKFWTQNSKMGRKKIQISRITDERNRQVSYFSKKRNFVAFLYYLVFQGLNWWRKKYAWTQFARNLIKSPATFFGKWNESIVLDFSFGTLFSISTSNILQKKL